MQTQTTLTKCLNCCNYDQWDPQWDEDGTNDMYIGGFKNGMPHGNGILITIISKYEGYDSTKIDTELSRLGRTWTTSKLYQYFLNAGVQLHESEFPYPYPRRDLE